ncbi:hypothetical protein [Streptomyces sp. NPDC048332]|uniref:hypothetical protein n=1 Tax=Streptomyces sp. NPDC048332 TaxID=3154619 RepID=UPI0034240FB4
MARLPLATERLVIGDGAAVIVWLTIRPGGRRRPAPAWTVSVLPPASPSSPSSRSRTTSLARSAPRSSPRSCASSTTGNHRQDGVLGCLAQLLTVAGQAAGRIEPDRDGEMSCLLHKAAALITENAGLQTYYATRALDPQGEAA